MPKAAAPISVNKMMLLLWWKIQFSLQLRLLRISLAVAAAKTSSVRPKAHRAVLPFEWAEPLFDCAKAKGERHRHVADDNR